MTKTATKEQGIYRAVFAPPELYCPDGGPSGFCWGKDAKTAAVQAIVERLIFQAGSAYRLARLLGCAPSLVWRWRHGRQRVGSLYSTRMMVLLLLSLLYRFSLSLLASVDWVQSELHFLPGSGGLVLPATRFAPRRE